jgi:hypothetical protein
METDYEALGARLLRPERPSLSRVVDWAKRRYGDLAVFSRSTGGHPAAPPGQEGQGPPVQELWEALAAEGLIPMSWVEEPARLFSGGSPRTERRSPRPWDLYQALLLAADVQGVLTAEALAWEVVARLQPWGSPRPGKVLWWLADSEAERALPELRLPGSIPWAGVFVALRAVDAFPLPEGQRAAATRRRAQLRARAAALWGAAFRAAALDADLDAAWGYAASRGLRLPEPTTSTTWPVGRAFSELPSPLQPMLEIWRVGYAFVLIRPDVVMLLMR